MDVPWVKRPSEWEIHGGAISAILCFPRNLVPSCVVLVIPSPKWWYNRCVQM